MSKEIEQKGIILEVIWRYCSGKGGKAKLDYKDASDVADEILSEIWPHSEDFESLMTHDKETIATWYLNLITAEQVKPKRKGRYIPKVKICAGCGSFAHGNPGHDI